MGLLSRMMSDQGGMGGMGADGILSRYFGNAGRKVASGVRVNHTTAMNYSGCWAATRLITETISTLPAVMYKHTNGMRSEAISHPTYKVFCDEPNSQQTNITYVGQQLGFVVNWGNSFAEKVFDDYGRVAALWPIHPSRIPRCNVTEDPEDGSLTYRVNNDKGPPTILSQKRMFHVPGVLCEEAFWGKGVIHHAAESIGMGIATEQYGAAHFGNGGGPSVVLTHPKVIGAEGAERIRKSWSKRFSSPDKSHGLLVVEEGMTVTPWTFPPELNQFLGTRQFNITEIARWYNLPVHKLREMTRSTNNNIESESLDFVITSILPWLVHLEKEAKRQLLREDDKSSYFFKYLLQGLLRGDMAARSKFYKTLFEIGVFSINDILELEDRNPIGPKGDMRFVPMNFSSLDNAFSGKPIIPPATKPDPAKAQSIEDFISGLMQLADEHQKTLPEPKVVIPEPVAKDEPDATQTLLATAAQSVLSSTISDMLWYEGKKATREAQNTRTFEAWCNQFYDDKFTTLFADKVRPMLAASTVFGATMTAEQLTATHCEASKRELLALMSVGTQDFAGAVQATISNWESRAFTESAMVFSKGAA